MMGHNVCFEGEYGKLSLKYPFYPFLFRALCHFLQFNADLFKLLKTDCMMRILEQPSTNMNKV